MREDRRRRYDDGFRREALELIKSGAGKDTLARRLAIPVYTARNWIRLYRSNGEEAVMGGGGSRRYDWETKVAAARDHVENGLTIRLGDEGRRGARPRRERSDQDGGHGQARDREHRAVGALVPRIPGGRSGGAQAETQGTAEGREIQTETQADARAGARRTGRVPEGEGRVPGKTPGPAGVQVTRRERSAVVRLLAGRGHRLDHLLEIAGLPRSTYFYHLAHPARTTRPDLEPLVREIWGRTANGCGHRQVRMCLVHEFGQSVSAKSVPGVMRRMGLRCAIRSRNPWRRYSSYRGETGGHVHNLLKRDFTADRPFSKLGTDVTEFKVAGSKAYLAPVYDMASKEIVAWDVSRRPDMAQQKRLLAMLAERLPAGAEPILHSDMGWQYQHQWWRDELERLGIRQSMSRKGNCLDNAATEQVFGHLKDEFYRGREFDSFERFKAELDAYIVHWNTRRRQIRLEGRTPEEFRSMSLAV